MITKESALGAIDTARDQKTKIAMSNKHGTEMFSFIDNMGKIFEEFHRDNEVKYPETNQFAFENENLVINQMDVSEILYSLINTGVIIQKSNRQKKSLNKDRGTIYQFNRIFAPIYHYSFRTRGGFNLIITGENLLELCKEDVKLDKYTSRVAENNQISLSELEEDGDDDAEV